MAKLLLNYLICCPAKKIFSNHINYWYALFQGFRINSRDGKNVGYQGMNPAKAQVFAGFS